MYIFFFNDTATTEIYTYGHTLSLHDALPISWSDIASRTVADVGSLPSAIVRTTMSRSVTMPTSLSPSPTGRAPMFRSEEHTSELQSLMRISYAVFCLKKKYNNL